MAWKSMKAMGLPCRLVKAKEIAQGVLFRKLPEKAAIVLAPGGNARLKAAALGKSGREAIRQWVRDGGIYLGFCGGAGLALSQKQPEDGLGLCPWTRASYPQRFYHMLTGHILASISRQSPLALPVWWPGRFAANEHDGVETLARYLKPSEDLWLADLPLAKIPENVLALWRNKPGVDPEMNFPAGQPLTVKGKYGNGSYILSYAHLETPGSRQANEWLASLLLDLTGISAKNTAVPDWHVWPAHANNGWRPENFSIIPAPKRLPLHEAMAEAARLMGKALNLGYELGLLFRRAPWLCGWRPGIPGMACNNLQAALAEASSLQPGPEAKKLWHDKKNEFQALLQTFTAGMEAFFWSSRIKNTLESCLHLTADPSELRNESLKLFGHPATGGGMAQKLLNFVEDIIYLSQGASP